MMKKMKKIIIYDDYNSKVPQNQDVIGTVTTQFGNSALRHGWKTIEVYEVSGDKSNSNRKHSR